MEDFTIYNTKKEIIDIINKCGLAPTVVLYLLRDISNELETIASNNIKQQLESQSEQPPAPIEEEE